MIRVVVTGSECTGKTTLARALARHYHTAWAGEFARDFVARKGAPVEEGDVGEIARSQIAREEEAAAGAGRLLILDTDLLSTIVYSRHYYGGCPRWIEDALARRAADLYLLAGIDVPWVADGTQRDRGDRREEMHALFRDALASRQLPFAEVRGPLGARIRQAATLIDGLLQPTPRAPSAGPSTTPDAASPPRRRGPRRRSAP